MLQVFQVYDTNKPSSNVFSSSHKTSAGRRSYLLALQGYTIEHNLLNTNYVYILIKGTVLNQLKCVIHTIWNLFLTMWILILNNLIFTHIYLIDEKSFIMQVYF